MAHSRQSRWELVLLAIVGVATPAAHGDAVDRMRLETLRATHEAVELLQTQRRPVALTSGFLDVRTLLHVHSSLSHDSRGTIEEILSAANDAGVRVIMFSEHPSNEHDYFLDGHRGLQNGVLLVPGAETGGFLAYPRRSIQNQSTDSPQALADLVRATGGLAFVSHLEERMDWTITGVTGMEIYNTHADFKDEQRLVEAFRSPPALLGIAAAVRQYPQEVFAALLDYPADYLRRYDELCQQARHTGVAANDAHHNQAFRAKVLDDGQLQLEDALGEGLARLDPASVPPLKLLMVGRKPGEIVFELDLDPYVRSFCHVSTHLLLSEVSETQIWQALSEGRVYVAFDWMADPTGFVFQAERQGERWPMGSELPLGDGLRLRAEAPLAGHIVLIRDGQQIHEERGRALEFAVDKPGVYRVEVWLNVAGERRPWILANPIYVRASGQ